MVSRCLTQLDDQCAAEVLEVEGRYATRRQPLYQERGDVISRMPGFWANVFTSDPVLAPSITSRDAAVLAHATRFEVETGAGLDFTLVLHMDAANPYTENLQLRKQYHTQANGHATVTYITSSGITWRRDTPQGREAAGGGPGSFQMGHASDSFLDWFARTETLQAGQRDEVRSACDVCAD